MLLVSDASENTDTVGQGDVYFGASGARCTNLIYVLRLSTIGRYASAIGRRLSLSAPPTNTMV
ncbi:MAG: hypothetical protein ACOX31_00090 [Eubacteriales bacterium]